MWAVLPLFRTCCPRSDLSSEPPMNSASECDVRRARCSSSERVVPDRTHSRISERRNSPDDQFWPPTPTIEQRPSITNRRRQRSQSPARRVEECRPSRPDSNSTASLKVAPSIRSTGRLIERSPVDRERASHVEGPGWRDRKGGWKTPSACTCPRASQCLPGQPCGRRCGRWRCAEAMGRGGAGAGVLSGAGRRRRIGRRRSSRPAVALRRPGEPHGVAPASLLDAGRSGRWTQTCRRVARRCTPAPRMTAVTLLPGATEAPQRRSVPFQNVALVVAPSNV